MIHIITSANRAEHLDLVRQMHVHRRIVFMEQLGWRLEAQDGLERDRFDTPEAIYLIETDISGAQVLQSARLLASLRPHLLSEVFSGLCIEGVPRGASIWEASRFCPAPSTPKGEARRRLLFRMIAAILETGLTCGIERITHVASAALAPLSMRAGWCVRPLGPPSRRGRDRVVALEAIVDREALERVRQLHALEAPLTRIAGEGRHRAA